MKPMRIVYNSLIPFKGFSAITLFGVIFARKEEAPLTPRTIRHEDFHLMQVWHDFQTIPTVDKYPHLWAWVKFYCVYLWQWVSVGLKYSEIPIEKEAYAHCLDDEYIAYRARKAWRTYKKVK